MKNSIKKPNKRTVTASIRNFAVSHPRLVTMGIYAGVALAISAAMSFILYPDEQLAFAIKREMEEKITEP